MLTETYALVAITAEQQNMRRVLSNLKESIDDNFLDRQNVEPDEIESMLNKLVLVERYFHARAVVRSVIPSIRHATTAKEDLLSELDALSAHAKLILQNLREGSQSSANLSSLRIEKLHFSMQQFCQILLKRLDQEEAELFPLAQQVLTPDEWFEVATHCLLSERDNRSRNQLQQLSESDLSRRSTRAGIERRMKKRYSSGLNMSESYTM